MPVPGTHPFKYSCRRSSPCPPSKHRCSLTRHNSTSNATLLRRLIGLIQVSLLQLSFPAGLIAQSDLPESSIPTIQSTIPSPLQYGYRTKITPHFEPPPKKLQNQGQPSGEGDNKGEKPSWLKIGFNQVGRRVVMDIEVWRSTIQVCPTIRFYGIQDCPIATPVLNEAYGPMRDDIAK
jgi:hypothetical protein